MASKCFDTTQFDAWADKVKNIAGGELADEFLKGFCRNMAGRVVSKTKKRNAQPAPIGAYDTGYMTIHWKAGEAKSSGNDVYVEISNPAKYATYIEYGHRLRNGMWWTGRFMLTISMDEVRLQMPARFTLEFKQFLKAKGIAE